MFILCFNSSFTQLYASMWASSLSFVVGHNPIVSLSCQSAFPQFIRTKKACKICNLLVLHWCFSSIGSYFSYHPLISLGRCGLIRHCSDRCFVTPLLSSYFKIIIKFMFWFCSGWNLESIHVKAVILFSGLYYWP